MTITVGNILYFMYVTCIDILLFHRLHFQEKKLPRRRHKIQKIQEASSERTHKSN